MIIKFPKNPPSVPEAAGGLRLEKHASEQCPHENTIINVKAATLKCDDCGAYLDAFAYLVEWSRKKEYWERCRQEREQHELDHAQETRAAALEACEFYRVTPEGYTAWWNEKANRKQAREQLKAQYEHMVQVHKSTGHCTAETMYVISNRKGWFELRCYVCGAGRGSCSLPPEFGGVRIHRHRDRLFEKIKSASKG